MPICKIVQCMQNRSNLFNPWPFKAFWSSGFEGGYVLKSSWRLCAFVSPKVLILLETVALLPFTHNRNLIIAISQSNGQLLLPFLLSSLQSFIFLFSCLVMFCVDALSMLCLCFVFCLCLIKSVAGNEIYCLFGKNWVTDPKVTETFL